MSEFSEERPIDLESLGLIIARLEEAVRDHKKDPGNLYILDSVVKRFELTYELSFRNLRRVLLETSPSKTEIEGLSFQGIIRRGDKVGLLRTGWPDWKDFRDARNETVHTYREEKAREVAKTAEVFVAEAEHLLQSLKRRLANDV